MARTRILLADDHDIVRKGLRYLLGKHHDLEIVGEALDGRQSVRLVESFERRYCDHGYRNAAP